MHCVVVVDGAIEENRDWTGLDWTGLGRAGGEARVNAKLAVCSATASD